MTMTVKDALQSFAISTAAGKMPPTRTALPAWITNMMSREGLSEKHISEKTESLSTVQSGIHTLSTTTRTKENWSQAHITHRTAKKLSVPTDTAVRRKLMTHPTT